MADSTFAGHGIAYVAPAGTAIPATYSEALDAAYVDLGEVSEDGLTHAFSVASDPLRNWAGNTVRTLKSTVDITFALSFLDDSQKVLELFYGQALDSEAGTSSSIKLDRPVDASYVMAIELVDGDKAKRYVLPRVEVSEREDLSINPTTVGYGMTFTALYDATLDTCGTLQFSSDLATTPGGLTVAKAEVKAAKK